MKQQGQGFESFGPQKILDREWKKTNHVRKD